MSKLTASDVEDLLQEHLENEPEAEQWGATWDWFSEMIPWKERQATIEVVGLGPVKIWEHDFGGVETNLTYLMFQVGDRVFRKEGRYYSHDGMYWGGWFREVKPVEKVFTDYEVI